MAYCDQPSFTRFGAARQRIMKYYTAMMEKLTNKKWFPLPSEEEGREQDDSKSSLLAHKGQTRRQGNHRGLWGASLLSMACSASFLAGFGIKSFAVPTMWNYDTVTIRK